MGVLASLSASLPNDPQLWLVLAVAAVVTVVVWYFAFADARGKRTIIDMDAPVPCGDITLESLRRFNGADPFAPIYFAVRGTVYDVTKGRDFYGPGGGYHVFAGREVARALALMSLDAADCTDNLSGCTESQLATLGQWEDKFRAKYGVAGKVVPPRELTLDELAAHDGRTPGQPILLAIKGMVYDVTKGKDYYGPDGVYPFGGRECARALAKYSTDLADCSDRLDDLDVMELDQLRDWQERFYAKYPIVGRVVAK